MRDYKTVFYDENDKRVGTIDERSHEDRDSFEPTFTCTPAVAVKAAVCIREGQGSFFPYKSYRCEGGEWSGPTFLNRRPTVRA